MEGKSSKGADKNASRYQPLRRRNTILIFPALTGHDAFSIVLCLVLTPVGVLSVSAPVVHSYRDSIRKQRGVTWRGER